MQYRARNIYLIPYAAWIVLFVVAPIVLIAYYSMFDIDGVLTLDNYRRFFTPVYMGMTARSFWYAFLITLFSLLVAYPTAYLLTKTKHKQLWLLLMIMPSWMNLLLKAYAFIGMFGTYGPVNALLGAVGIGTRQILFTDFSFIFVAVYIFVPFMILPIFNALDELNPSLVAAARDLGASRWDTFRRVVFPDDQRGQVGCRAVHPGIVAVHDHAPDRRQPRDYLGTAIEQHFLVTQDWGMGSTIAVFLIIAWADHGADGKRGGGKQHVR